jgi:hypothetical protein
MSGAPDSPTVSDMFEHAAPQLRDRSETLLRQCTSCSHSEFVHADDAPRWCLFSECACSSYTIDLAALEARIELAHFGRSVA